MISVAIDGPSGAGKSTIAKDAAKRFGFVYVDTGAIYRTIGLAAFERNADTSDKNAVLPILPELSIELKYNAAGEQRMYLDGTDVSDSIRRNEISMCASNISAMPEVREFLMDMQRDLAKKHDVIMDGRDIGTVILPDADVKIFLTASAEKRAKRRVAQLAQKGIILSYEDILSDMKKRDEQDINRKTAPLKPAPDAEILDTSDMSLAESLNAVSELIINKTGAAPIHGE